MRNWAHSVRLRWRALVRRRRLDRDLAEELAFHRDMRAAKYRALGIPDPEARWKAQRRFGNAVLIQEGLREMWTFAWLEGVGRDVQQAARSLARSPGFAMVAVVTLALGIGANTSVFSVMNALFLRSLPVRDPQHLRILNWKGRGPMPMHSVYGYGRMGSGDDEGGSFPYPMLAELRRTPGGAADVAAFTGFGANAAARGHAYVARGLLVTTNFFEILGVEPALGRGFRPEEDRAEAAPVVVISYRLWERLFGADRSTLGATVELGRKPYTLIGVLPPKLTGLSPGEVADVYLPLARVQEYQRWSSLTEWDNWWVQMVARLRKPGDPAGASEQLRRAADSMLARATAEFNAPPGQKEKANRPWTVLVDGRAGLAFVQQDTSEFLTALLALAGLVLLIACANVANLLVARGTARARELAIRQSLGAGSWRIARHLLTEAMLLATAGGTLGLALAQAGTPLLAGLLATRSDGFLDLRPDARVLAFSLGLSLATALLFGAAPALRAMGVRADSCLRQAGALAGGMRQRFAHSLVLVQVALATVLVVGRDCSRAR